MFQLRPCVHILLCDTCVQVKELVSWRNVNTKLQTKEGLVTDFIHLAVDSNEASVVKYLLEVGANLKHSGSSQPLLHTAIDREV